MELGLALGDQAAEDDRLAARGADGRLRRGDVDARRADDLAGGGDRDGDAFGLGPDFRLLGVDLHDDQAVGADPRRDAQDQADVLQGDVVDLCRLVDRACR